MNAQEGKDRLRRWADTATFECDKVAPGGKHNRLPERSRSVRLVRSTSCGRDPLSSLFGRRSAVTLPFTSVVTPYQVETASLLSHLSLRVQSAPSVASKSATRAALSAAGVVSDASSGVGVDVGVVVVVVVGVGVSVCAGVVVGVSVGPARSETVANPKSRPVADRVVGADRPD